MEEIVACSVCQNMHPVEELFEFDDQLLCNTYTIEFRIFRGTLKLNTLLATLQMIHRICDVALYLSDDEMKAMTWSAFVSGCSEYPELVQYLKERRLYVNEPVEMEEVFHSHVEPCQ